MEVSNSTSLEHDEAVIGKLIDFLQRSDFAGVILTRERMKALSLSAGTSRRAHCAGRHRRLSLEQPA